MTISAFFNSFFVNDYDAIPSEEISQIERNEKIERAALEVIIQGANSEPTFRGLPNNLPVDLIYEIDRFLDEEGARAFRATKGARAFRATIRELERDRAIAIKENRANRELDKIMISPECVEAFADILESPHLSSSLKLSLIKDQLRTEVEVFEANLSIESANSIISFVQGRRKTHIAAAQIHCADELVAALEIIPHLLQQGGAILLDEIKTSINLIKSDATSSDVEKAARINEAIKEHLNADDSEAPLKDRVLWLSLEDKNLRAILPCIGELFPNLQELVLDDNRLTFLPETLSGLANLGRLSLNRNRLTGLPDALRELTNLRDLNLSGNRLTVFPKVLCELTNLWDLSLSGNRLTFFPETLSGGLANLRDLYLDGNRLTFFPEVLCELTNLQNLYLGGNLLTGLPDAFRELTNLLRLCLNSNRLTFFPEVLCELTNLIDLYLDGNRLTVFPETLSGLANLRHLSLNDNRLTFLPDALGEVTHLAHLGLNDNRLTDLPEALRELTHLTHLRLNGNQLTGLPDALRQLTNLRYLYLNDNQLAVSREDLRELTNLQELHLYNNRPTRFHRAVRSMGFHMRTIRNLFWGE